MNLDDLRRTAAHLLLLLLWVLAAVALGLDLLGPAPGSPAWLASGLAGGMAAGLTLPGLRRPDDEATRYLLTVGLMGGISILVWRVGPARQIDLHMAYFAGLALVAAFCDLRAILLGAALVAVHHLGLGLLLPGAVFPIGDGGIDRILLHAGILVIEAAALAWVTHRLDQAARAATLASQDAASARLAEHAAIAQSRSAEEDATAAARQARTGIAARMEAEVGAVTQAIAETVLILDDSSRQLADATRRAARDASQARDSVDGSMTEVRTVAAAAEDLSRAVGEITRHVAHASAVARQAVAESETTNATVRGLADAANEVGSVVRLIGDIAGQTNLLALNATIEAARAGETGKGFAVVAAEVKTLATDTARATEQISAQIAAIQAQTHSAVAAIGNIGRVVAEVDQVASAISAAVEQQGAATRDIATAASRVAAGTGQAVDATGHAAEAIGAAAGLVAPLEKAAAELRGHQAGLDTAIGVAAHSIRHG